VVSPVEVLGYELGLAEAERDVAAALQAVERTKLDVDILEAQRVAELASERIQRNKIEPRLDVLGDLLNNAQRNVVFVNAPYDGVVLSLAAKRVGDVVAVGQELCEISPVDARTRARLAIHQSGVPRLEEGQPVKLYLDAFPYQRYGVVGATLEWVSPAAVTTDEGKEFVAYARLDQETIAADGRDAPLRVGMGGEARINVGKRTLVEYAFEPLRQLQENLLQQKQLKREGALGPGPESRKVEQAKAGH
jgi:HlyD family secretion protein